MRKLKLFFACLLMAVLSIGQVWATDVTSKMDLDDQSPAYTANTTSYTGTQSATWSLSKTCASQSVGSESSASNDKYYQIGSGSKNATSMTWSSSSFNGKKIKQVVVKCSSSASASGSNKATVTVSATGGTFSPATSGSNVLSGSTYTTVTFNSSASGGDQISGNLTVNIAFSSQQQKNIRLYQIDVIYVNDETPSCTEPATALSITNANTATLGTPLTLTSTGGNGGTIIWSVAAGTGTASVSGNVLTPLTKGTVTVTATQAENDGKCGAAPTQEITISKAAPAPIAGTVVDEITVGTTGVTSGSYTAFSGRSATNTGHSAAVYAGKIIRGGTSGAYTIQMNTIGTSNAGREIVSTTSGGNVKRVEVIWGGTNTAGRKITIYGSNDAYTGSETATSGTKLGEIEYAANDVSDYIDVEGSYKYVQLVVSGAMYISQINITWLPSKSAVTFNATPNHGLVSIEDNGTEIATGDEIAEGTVLDVILAGDDGYVGTVAVTKTTGGNDVTSTVYNATTSKLTMPDYAITVTATFAIGVEAPEFDPASNTYTSEQLVTISTVTNGASIYYTMTTDGSTPADPTSASTPYDENEGITLDARGTYNIKAIAYKGELHSTVASATYTLNLPFASVTELFTYLTDNSLTSLNDVIVTGYVSNIKSLDPTKYTSAQYYISANGQRENELYIYNGKYLNGADFTSLDQLAVGDKVTVRGNYLYFNNTTHEINTGSQITERVVKGAVTGVVVSGTATKTAYSANETFETGGLVVTVTYANGFSCAVTEGITWGDDLTDHKVATSGNVAVTATVGGVESAPYNVAITVSTKTVSSIAVGTGAYTIYTGEALPEPTVTATYSEGDPADVSAEATYDSENVFDTETPGEQTITVSYTFGANTVTTTYTVTVVDYANDADHPYTPEQALYITINAVGSTKATKDIYVQGKVSQLGGSISSGKWGYYISADGTTANQFQIYNGYYLNGANFTNDTKLHLNDEVIVKGKVIYYNSTTPEFATGESQVYSLARTPNFAITDVTALEVGAADLAVADLTITVEGEGAVTFASSNHEEYVKIVDGKLQAVAAGTATITANLAANGIYKAATTEFDVTVIAATVKYAVTFDSNGADGGSAPTAIANQAEGTEVTLPANSWTKIGYTFNGWKVINNTTSAEITVTAGVFEMPASPVTIKAQWTEIPVWAYTYTSNVAIASNESKQVTIAGTDYAAAKSNKGTTATITLPQGVTTIHLHLVAWKGEAQTVTVSGDCFNEAKELAIAANDAVSGTDAKYDLGASGIDYYFSLTPDNAVAENEVITITAASGKRFVLFGVNAIYPEITLDPASFDFENVRADQQKQKVFTITKNESVTGDLSASIINDANSKYSVGSISGNKVTVTFNPNGAESGTFTAKLKIAAGNAEVTANLQGTAIAAEAPEIVVDKNAIAFDRVDPNAEVSETISVELLHITGAVSATLEGTNTDKFTLSTTSLSANGNIVVTPNTTANGIFSATLKLTATDADDVEIPLSITVANKWAVTYTSNVAIASNESKQVTIAGTDYAAAKSNKGTTATITLPQGVTTIHLHLVAWKGEAQTVTVSGDCFNEAKELAIAANDAVSGTDAKYDLGASGIDYYFSLTPDNAVAANEVITITAASGKRFVLFGVNQEGGIYGTYTRTVSGNYGTICLPKAGVLTNGTLFEIAYYGQTSKKIFFDEILNNEMVAGRPYLFKPNDGVTELRVNYTDSEDPVAAGNYKGLHGFYNLADENATFDIEQDAGNYIMYSNQYWLVSGRAAYIENYRAYIVLSDITTIEPAKAPGTRRVSLNVNGEQTATDIDALNAEETPVKMMINGQLFILRGEKLYDATGRLVK